MPDARTDCTVILRNLRTPDGKVHLPHREPLRVRCWHRNWAPIQDLRPTDDPPTCWACMVAE